MFMGGFFRNLKTRQGLLALSVVVLSASAGAAPLCENVFRDQQHRLELVRTSPQLELRQIVWQMQIEGKLIYKGKHKYKAGSDFMASNEFDWLATPFDNKPADVLVAFGTNSAWEIAANKRVKSLYVADWSPYPLMAHAYIVSPLMKISKTPHEFITLLSGRVPTPELLSKELSSILQNSFSYSLRKGPEKIRELQSFLDYLAKRDELSDFDLQFLTSYFKGMAGENATPDSMGPFKNLRHPTFARLIGFYNQRYSPAVSGNHHLGKNLTNTLEEYSIFSSQENFDRVRDLFVKNKVKYGLASITDLALYDSIKAHEDPGRSYALSVTNIFDCGCYNGLTAKDYRQYLVDVSRIFEARESAPMVVFGTRNTDQPHTFYRYDVKSPSDVLWLDIPGDAAMAQ